MENVKNPLEKPFWVEGEGQREKPFVVGNESQRDKPFIIDFEKSTTKIMESKLEKVSNVERSPNGENIANNRLQAQSISPIYRISEDVAALAQRVCESCLPIMGDMSNVLPYIEVALEQCKKSGGKLPVLLPGTKKINNGMLNFELKLVKRICTIFDTEQGEKEEYSYEIQIMVTGKKGNKKTFQAIVASEKVKGVEWLKKATHSLATLPKGKDEQEDYRQLVQECIEQEEVPEEFLYPRAGWRDVPGRGWRYVYGSGMIGDSNIARTITRSYDLNLNTAQLGTKENFLLAMEMRHICHNDVASTELLVFVHATVLKTLFDKAGYPLDFVFGIMGVTNSRKTSLVLAMAKLFNRDNLVADAEFATATACGIEKTLSRYGDSVVFVDDFKPGVSKQQQKEMDRKLDELVRFYGNRVTKKRMTDFIADGNKKFFPIGGGCVLTMEILTGVSSSLTRMFVTELGLQDVHNERLQIFQDDTRILPTYIYHFLAWVTINFNEILEFITTEYPWQRQQYACKIGRYSGMYAAMMVTANILKFYAEGYEFWTEKEAEVFVEQVRLIIIGELRRMENRLNRRDKGRTVIKAFLEGVNERRIVPLILNSENVERKADAYEDGQRYYIQVRLLRQLVEEYCQKYHEQTEFVSDDEILGLLEKNGVLEIIEREGGRERSRKLPIQKNNAKRYLYLPKARLQKFEGDF